MNREAMATLEAVETKVLSGFDKGMEMREKEKAKVRQVQEHENLQRM